MIGLNLFFCILNVIGNIFYLILIFSSFINSNALNISLIIDFVLLYMESIL